MSSKPCSLCQVIAAVGVHDERMQQVREADSFTENCRGQPASEGKLSPFLPAKVSSLPCLAGWQAGQAVVAVVQLKQQTATLVGQVV